MPRWLVRTLLIVLVLLPSPASAQGETKLEAISIELLSEYDRPSMLVIYQFLVSQETPLPAEIKLRIPKDVNVVAVAVETNGDLFNKNITSRVEQGNWQFITIQAETYEPHRIEYYQPLNQEGDKREFKFQWYGGYSVKEFNINLLIPSDSTGLVTSPALQETVTTPDGDWIAGKVTKTDLKMMSSFHFELEYQRTSTALVKPEKATAQIVPATPVDENTPGRVSITNLPWIIGAFGLALIVIALFSYWRSTQTSESQPRRRRRYKTVAVEQEEGQAYCHECGTRAHPGDRFCRTCGSRLRVE